MFETKGKGIITICILLTICSVLCINATAASSLHWYCKRTNDHTQPGLDSDLQIINQLNGFYLDKQHSDDSADKVVYLTFDAGYENGNVEKILDVLKREQVSGAFFILGNLIQRNPDLVLRMVNEGHLVCNHTYHHKDITKLTEQDLFEEISSLEQAYQNLTGKQMSKYFRPPEGVFDAKSLKYLSEQGYKTIFWSFAYADWDNHKQMNPDQAKKKILDHLHNGEILLLHPTSQTNVQILESVIKEIKQQGYRFGSLNELEGSNA